MIGMIGMAREVKAMLRMGWGSFLRVLGILGMVAAAGVRTGEAEAVDFSRDVRPILSGHCFKCHGPDAAQRKAKLRLDAREAAVGRVIVAGDAEASELVRRIFSEDSDEVMPPPSANLALSEDQKAVLRQWVAEGAEYEDHWAFVKPEQPALPEVTNRNWPRNAIDYFVLARLEAAGMKPSEPADKYTLVRRVYLDLTGLPPTPEEADAFVMDNSAGAYERLVDRLLASPHYGERWARPWLDLARYADTNGYEKDRPRSIWPWRDWVIGALNADMPFDRFTIEQLAGDMLPEATQDQRIATGFHRNSMLNEEGGTDPQEFRFYSLVDRVHVTATTWLGLTMACAQCHHHKYDPISQREYYQFMAFFNNANEPKLDVVDPAIRNRRKEIRAEIAGIETNLLDRFPPEKRMEWTTPVAMEFRAESGAQAERLPDGSLLVWGENPEEDVYTVEMESDWAGVTELQLYALPDNSLGNSGPGRSGHGNFVLSEIEVKARAAGGGEEPVAVELVAAHADYSQEGFSVSGAIDGKEATGWAIDGGERSNSSHVATFIFAEPVGFESGTRYTVRLRQHHGKHHTLGRFRLSLGVEVPDPRPLEERRRENLDRRLARWLYETRERVVAWEPLEPVAAESNLPVLTIQEDGSIFASFDFTKSDTYRIRLRNPLKDVTAIRLEALPDERLPANGPGGVYYEGPPGDFFLSSFKLSVDGKPVELAGASESFASGGNTAAKALDEDAQSGWSINGGQGKPHNAVFFLDEPLHDVSELNVEMLFERYYPSPLGRFRLWVTAAEAPEALAMPNTIREIFLVDKEERTPDQMRELKRYFASIAPEMKPAREEIARLRRSLPEYPTTLVMQERPAEHARVTHIHKRGEYLQPTEAVEPDVPAFLPPLPEGAPRNRLTLARWLVSPENPLTPRVVMNRQWAAMFGQGLVRTVEDFGYQGDLPTHPLLLDWLAVEFVERGWSLKRMHKLMVMSATYRQSSAIRPELEDRDPENHLLARGPRFRLDAELVRDTALVAGGLLTETIGGKSVFPPQPASVTTEGAYGKLEWKVSAGPNRYRRGLYTYMKRTAPYAMFTTFDAPTGEACVARRERSNTPLQALTLLNDEVFVEVAQVMGSRSAAEGHDPEIQVRRLFRRCLTRPPDPVETRNLLAYYHAQKKRLAAEEAIDPAAIAGIEEDSKISTEAATERAAWTLVARALLNLDERITKE